MFVDSQGFLGWWSGGGTRQDGDPSREQPWLGSSYSPAASLVVLAKVSALSLIFLLLASDSIVSFYRHCAIKYNFLLLLLSKYWFRLISNPYNSVELPFSRFLCRWFTPSQWCWSGSCIPVEQLCLWVRTSRTPPSLCPGGPVPPCTLTTLRSATPPR